MNTVKYFMALFAVLFANAIVVLLCAWGNSVPEGINKDGIIIGMGYAIFFDAMVAAGWLLTQLGMGW